MKTEGISFYFVLYVIAVITVFVITMERDQLLKERDEDIAHLVELYVRPLVLTPYLDTAFFSIDPTATVGQVPVTVRTRVEGPLEKSHVSFSLVRTWKDGETLDFPSGEISVLNEDGDGLLSASGLTEGVYAFQVAGSSNRIVADGNKISLRVKDTTYIIPYSPQLQDVDRDTVILIARVEQGGIDPLQFGLTVQDETESWILGPPYQKKLFLTGVIDASTVTFSPPAGTRIERPPQGGSFVTFVWDRPVLGKRAFNVSGNATRGFGGKDQASVRFTVDILPPSFVNEPSANGYWGVPYTFDGKIRGLNPVDLSLQVVRSGEIVAEGSGVNDLVFVPERGWESLEYRVAFRGHTIKTHPVALSAPPPPQIRWIRQELDRSQNIFKISVSAADAANGPVRISVESQPSGIARIDKISGTDFTVSISLADNPSAVFLKLTASDKFGGRSVSTKQYNIPK